MKTFFRIYTESTCSTGGWLIFEDYKARFTDKKSEATRFNTFKEVEYILSMVLNENVQQRKPKELELEIRKYYTN